jgi:hypothetical protein
MFTTVGHQHPRQSIPCQRHRLLRRRLTGAPGSQRSRSGEREKWPPVARGPKGLAQFAVRWRTEQRARVRRESRIVVRDRRAQSAKKGLHCGGFPDGGAHSLGWLEHPADNREVMSSNLIGPTPPLLVTVSKKSKVLGRKLLLSGLTQFGIVGRAGSRLLTRAFIFLHREEGEKRRDQSTRQALEGPASGSSGEDPRETHMRARATRRVRTHPRGVCPSSCRMRSGTVQF